MTRLGLVLALLVLGGCNVYNPSGKGDPDTDKEWIEQGEAQLRDLDFVGAQRSFGKVLAHDSSSTPAWVGYGKAVAARKLDMSLLLREALESQREHRKPLWDTSFTLAQKDSAYRGLAPVRKVLETWARLDSLGRASMPPRNRLERGLIAIAHSMLSLWDSNNDGRIDPRGDALAIALFGNLSAKDTTGLGFVPFLQSNQFSLDSNGLPDTSGKVDSAKVREYNALLSRTDTEFRTIANLAVQDTAMAAIYSGISGQNPQALSMFEVANVEDDDFDGCADEEIIDYRDNDGDGLIDEDTRVGHVNPLATAPGDLAQVSRPDGVRGDRLANPRTGKGMPGLDSVGTLRLGRSVQPSDAFALLEVFRPMWDPTNPEYPTLRWKWKVPNRVPMAPADRAALTQRLKAIPTGAERAALGCSELGGCWCKVQRDICAKGSCE